MQVKTFIGLPPSKKNSKQIITNRKTRNPMIVSSDKYQKWERQYTKVFAASFVPVNKARLTITFLFVDGRIHDLTNLAEGILDALVKAKVIKDDNRKVIPSIFLDSRQLDNGDAGFILEIDEILQ